MDPFASPHNLDSQLHSLLGEASSKLCDWLADSGSQGPMPDLFELPEVSPEKELWARPGCGEMLARCLTFDMTLGDEPNLTSGAAVATQPPTNKVGGGVAEELVRRRL